METMTCPTCEGMGRVTYQGERGISTATCPFCNGQGRIIKHDPAHCEICNQANN